MSTISEDSPSHRKSILGRAIKRNNRITSPTHLSQTSSAGRKTDVIELFTIKPQSRTFSGPRKGKTKAKRRKVLTSDSQDTSELSDDVFAVTKQVSIESFAKSETKSYKERINERFESIKKKAGKSTKSANVFKETVNKILLEKVRRESSDVDVDLQSVRSKFNLTGRSEQRSELHNFFCSERNDQNEDDHTEEGEEFKSTDELTKDDSVARFTLPENVRFGVKIAEKDLFFTPKAKPVEINDKLEGKEPRHLEEEGFYVQKPPKVPLGHLHLLEQRLSKDDKKWFNCEGKLNIAESPVLKTSIRPPIKPLPTEETTAYLPAKITNEECEEIVVVRENVLQLQISTLTFAHHPLFSVEHVLAQNLKGLYSEYEKAESSNVIGRLRQKLEALRSMKVELQKRDLQSGDHAPDDLEKKMAYMREIKKLQDSLFTEGKMERDRLKSILAMWKAIKKVRVKNQYSNTSIRLVIKKTAVKYAEEKEEFKRQIDAACEETIEELRTKYDTPDEDDDDDDDDGNPSIDEDEIRTEVLSKFKESFRPPGEPILSFALLEDHEVTKGVEDSKEKARRNAVSLTKLCLKIICNKVEVCKTKFVTLTDTFVCKFDETISIQLINVPKFLTIEIIEHPKSLVKRTVGEIALKLPSRHVSSGNLKFKDVSFEKKEIVHYKHEGVGSGVKVQSVLEDFGGEVYEKRKKVPEKASENKEEEEELNSSGFLSLTLGWDTAAASDEYGEDPTSNSEIIGEIIDKNGVVDTDKLMEWLHQSKPDPQDPKNSVLYEYTREIDNEMIPERKNTSYFRLSPYIGNFQFCDPTVLDENIRLTILELRNNNEPEFDGMLVPNRIKEIPFTILADYRRRKAAESESLVVDDDHDEDEIEARRSRGRKCLKQIHIKIFQLCKNAQNNLTFEDVVGEELLVHFEKMVRSLVNRCINWLRWRPLKPSLLPQEQHKQHQDYQTATPVKIILKAMSATNIPNRSGSKGTDGKKEEVKPFVEVTYNDVQVRTSTAQGPNPVWNQELVVPLDSMHVDYLNPNSLNGTVVVNIFDEFDQVLDKFGGIKKKTWLGYLEISLSAICYTEMTGSFKVRLPQLLIGYEKED